MFWKKKDEAIEGNLGMFVSGLLKEVHELRERADKQGHELERLRKDHDFVGSRVDNISKGVIKAHESSGGYWKTASGHTMRIRDMSTDHIKHCLAGNFGGAITRGQMEREMKRRKEENYWRSQPMPGKVKGKSPYLPTESVQDPYNPEDNAFEEVDLVGYIDQTPVYVDDNIGMLQKRRVKAFIQRAREMKVL